MHHGQWTTVSCEGCETRERERERDKRPESANDMLIIHLSHGKRGIAARMCYAEC